MKKITLTLICLITVLLSQAQSPDFLWAKDMGGIGNTYANAIATDAQGNVYTTGRFTKTMDFDPGPGTFSLVCMNNSGYYNMFISKVDAAGNFVWAKGILGTGLAEGYGISIDQAGNIFTVGNYGYVIDFDPGIGTNTTICTTGNTGGVFVLKLDPNGNFIWVKQTVDIPISGATGRSITTDALGNVYTTGDFIGGDFDPGAGTFTLTQPGNVDAFVSKLDPAGNFVWVKSFPQDNSISGASCGFCIKADASNNIYVSGNHLGNTNFDQGGTNFSITTAGSRDAFIAKFTSAGTLIWAKSMGGNAYDEAYSTAIDALGNVYTSGFFNASADFDPGAGTYSLTASGNYEVFISKLDASGNFVWAKNIGSGSYITSGTSISLNDNNSIGIDAAGFVYTLGNFSGTKDFDPNAGVFNLTSFGSSDIFISRLDPLGNFAGAKQLGGTSSDVGKAIAIDGLGNVCATGYFAGTADFDPGVGTYNLTSVAIDIFIYKMAQTTMGLKDNASIVKMSMYPNPTSGSLTFELDAESYLTLTGITQIEISNSLGQLVAKEQMSSNQLKIDIANLNNGIYFVKVINDNNSVATKKIIKQ